MNLLTTAKIISLVACVMGGVFSYSQDSIAPKESFLKRTQSSISGGAGFVGTFYHVEGIDARRDPFFWQFNASLNISSNGVSIPFSAVISQQNRSFTQPFNQFGLSPKYKAFKAHIGFRSMRLSEFSLNGNQFLGLGVEYTPSDGLVSAKALFGRFAKAVDGYYSDGLVIGTPSYERWGYGAGVTVGTTKNNIGLVFFRAKDDEQSIAGFEEDATVKPGQNMVVGLNTKQKISEHWSFDAEIDWSAYTEDIRIEESFLEGYSYINNLKPLFFANTTTAFAKAMEANLNYKTKKFSTQFGYRRIDPNYRTMGSVYLNNDFEDITAKIGTKLAQNKVMLSLTGGLQRNNLDDSKVSEMLRLIGSFSASYVPNQNWAFTGSYANYNTQTQSTLVSTSIAEDTLRYAQVTRNGSVRVTRNLTFGKNRASVFAMATYQNALINGEVNTEFKGGNVGFNYSVTALKLNAALSLSANENTTATTDILAIGPNLALSKSILHSKVTLSLVNSLLQSYSGGEETGQIINSKLASKYRLNRAHSFSATVGFAWRNDPSNTYQEMIATIGYKYNFRKP